MKIFKSCLIAACASMLGTGIALATSPHFINATDSIDSVTGDLTCSWKEAGLGNNQNIDYKCEAQGSATYVCVNHGGANPSASNKTTVGGPVSATGTFNSGRNGQITASLTVHPPSAGSFSCPSGQSMELAQVSYTDVFLTDLTNSISQQLTNRSTGCLLPNVRGACD
jgi:hypothetical protein